MIVLSYRGYYRLLALKVEKLGQPATAKPVLFVANHVSYLDILIIGRQLKARSMAKSDVRLWSAIGALASLAGTIFVERRPRKSRQQRDMISASLVLFPEGTSSDGSRVLTFRCSLFSVFETGSFEHDVAIQPVTIDYTTLRDGQPIDGDLRGLPMSQVDERITSAHAA